MKFRTAPRKKFIRTDYSVCVLVIDMQESFVRYLTPAERAQLVAAQRKVLEECVSTNTHVVVIEFSGHAKTILELEEVLSRIPSVTRLTKFQESGFTNAELHMKLRHFNARRLVLMGLNADHCVLATALSARHLGYQISTHEQLMENVCRCCKHKPPGYANWYADNGTHHQGPLDVKALLA